MTNLYHALTLLCFCAHMIVCPVGYWAIYRSASMIPHSCLVTLSVVWAQVPRPAGLQRAGAECDQQEAAQTPQPGLELETKVREDFTSTEKWVFGDLSF